MIVYKKKYFHLKQTSLALLNYNFIIFKDKEKLSFAIWLVDELFERKTVLNENRKFVAVKAKF